MRLGLREGTMNVGHIVGIPLCMALVACASPTSGTVDSAAAGGTKETTLAAFCRSPPKTTKPFSPESIRVSCQPRVLAKAGDAKVKDLGNGLYGVVFIRPVKRGSICDKGSSSQSICGPFLQDDIMQTSRINAP
jgi:hypothetical protein